jgi:cellulose synthase/poly-beta-1,6-N-acetylglucosamine synthase-like glycosyltransferase
VKSIVVGAYFIGLALLSVYGAHVYWLILWHRRALRRPRAGPEVAGELPTVTVQLPLYNEASVAARLIDTVASFDYPSSRLEIQIVDDSTDGTREISAQRARYWRSRGIDIRYYHRPRRNGFKAGALDYGLQRARGDLIAIFDADNLPEADFLLRTVGEFGDPSVGMVQARWGHLNLNATLLSRAQALYLDGHFLVEQTARSTAGVFFNFNGTAGVWRRQAIETAGGWTADTLTEDLDLSYRAQMAGWRFVFRSDVVVPSELPNDVRAFKLQQYRWARGAVQTARKTLPRLWQSRFPLRTKIAAAFHLTSKAVSVLMVLMTALLLPALWYRWEGGWLRFLLLDAPLFVLATGSMGVFYRHVQRAAGHSTRGLWWRMPLLMSVGIGLTVTNTRAVIDGLLRSAGEFERTPKSGIIGNRVPRVGWSGPFQITSLWETGCGLYSLAAIAIAALQGVWVAIPFMTTFAIGYLYLAWRGIVSQGSAARDVAGPIQP